MVTPNSSVVRARQTTARIAQYLSGTILLLFLSARTVYFTLGRAAEAVDNPIKTYTLLLAYILALLQISFHLRALERLVLRIWPYLALGLVVFATAPLGDMPVALLRGGHVLGLLFVAGSVLIGFRENYGAFLKLLFAFSFSCLVASIVIVYAVPGRGLVNFAGGNLRWVGVTGHPNGLGGLAIVCTWSLLALMGEARLSFARLLLGVAAAGVIVINLYGSESRSSQVAVLVMIALFAVLRGPRLKLPTIFGRAVVVMFFGIMLVVGVVAGGADNAPIAARQGSDDVLSGRPMIWAQGIQSIADAPLGVSFDDLSGFWSNFPLNPESVGLDPNDKFTHFHNGFIDVTAKGGLVGGVILLVLLVCSLRDITRVREVNYMHFVTSLSLFVAVVIYNCEETSFMREITLWPVQILDWTLLPALLIRRRSEVQRQPLA